MAADGEPKEDGGGSDSSESSASTSSFSPCPPSPPAAAQTGLHAHPSPLPAAAASSSTATAAASLPYSPHLYYQQRLLSLHLSPAAPPAQPRVANSEATPAPPPSDRPFRDDCWSENATLTLIQAWGARYLELNRGNLKQKHWKDVADSVNSRPLSCSKPPKTDVQCKNRLDTLKKKYKIEKSKLVTGGARSQWAFFDRLDELIGSSKKTKNSPSGKVSRSAAVVADAACTTNPDGPCMAMPAAAKCATEEDVKPPLFFIPPPQAAIALPPPPLAHHVGGVVVHMNHHLGNILHLNHHAGTAPIMHPLAGEGTHINHLAGMHNYHLAGSAAGAAMVNHQLGDDVGGAATAAANTASKSKADMSQSSLPHKRIANKREFKRKRDTHRTKEDGPFRELARALAKFADVYERVEIARLEQATALEKQRRELVKDLEIQRMQLFTQMQIEQAKIKYGNNKCSNAEDH